MAYVTRIVQLHTETGRVGVNELKCDCGHRNFLVEKENECICGLRYDRKGNPVVSAHDHYAQSIVAGE